MLVGISVDTLAGLKVVVIGLRVVVTVAGSKVVASVGSKVVAGSKIVASVGFPVVGFLVKFCSFHGSCCLK